MYYIKDPTKSSGQTSSTHSASFHTLPSTLPPTPTHAPSTTTQTSSTQSPTTEPPTQTSTHIATTTEPVVTTTHEPTTSTVPTTTELATTTINCLPRSSSQKNLTSIFPADYNSQNCPKNRIYEPSYLSINAAYSFGYPIVQIIVCYNTSFVIMCPNNQVRIDKKLWPSTLLFVPQQKKVSPIII
jgi:hypothetical protein